MVRVEIDYRRVEARVDGVAYTLSRIEWKLYAALWEAGGGYVSKTILSSKAGITLESVRWYISQLRKRIGVEAIKTHPRRWPGYRANIPMVELEFDFDFDYREDG